MKTYHPRLKISVLSTIKCFFLVTIFLLVDFAARAQDAKNPELDNHRYFKQIGLGDNIEKWKKHLTKVDSSTSIEEYLFDLRRCCNQVFDRDVQYLLVLVKNEIIVSVRIYLVDFLKEKSMLTTQELMVALDEMILSQTDLVGKFDDLFAKHSVEQTNEGQLVKVGKKPMLIHQWQGKRTLLTMEMFFVEASYGREKDPRTGLTRVDRPNQELTVISLTDMPFLETEKKEGF